MAGKDWGGNSKTFLQQAPVHNSNAERAEKDYYATDPKALEALLRFEEFSRNVWEPACGGGHLVKTLKDKGHLVKATDIVDRGCPGYEKLDFLVSHEKFDGDIITNPPYKFSTEFILKALESVGDGHKVAMLLRIQMLEGVERYHKVWSKFPPKYVYVFSGRQVCAPNGDFSKASGSLACYCWFVWVKGYGGEPTIRWIPPDDGISQDQMRLF